MGFSSQLQFYGTIIEVHELKGIGSRFVAES